jgi:nucleoside-diphosphate-sugar epimerase
MKRLNADDLEYIYQSTKENWQPLAGKSIFITGGTGFFGKWLLESFVYINKKLQLNASLTVLSRDPDLFLAAFPFYKSESAIHFIKGDILTVAFPSNQFQYIIHAATAADAVLNRNDPMLMLDTITEGTKRMLAFARSQPLESFLFTSSGAVYGKQPEAVTHVKEADGFAININDPLSAYAEGKRIAELYCSVSHIKHGLPVKIARSFAFVGPYLPLNKHFAIGNFLLNVLNQEDILIKGDGTPYRSYLYAADLAVWLWTILLKGENNVPYNVGSDAPYSIAEIAGLVAATNSKVAVKIMGKPKQGVPVERYVPSITRAQTLGLKVGIDIQQAILKTKEFYESV